MLAPEPFFEPRGTPFSEYHRIKALVEQGHHVDLVTYPIGANVDLPNLRIIRSVAMPFVKKVPIGPSATKAFLDVLLAVTALRQAMKQSYDAIHSHEEAGILGVWLSRRLGIPHLYDMHSSLPQQLSNFAFSKSRLLLGAFSFMERLVIRRSKAVIVICPQLEETVRAIDADVPTVLIENAPGSGDAPQEGAGAHAVSYTHLTLPTILRV